MGEAVSRCVILCAAPVDEPQALADLLREDDYILAADGGLRLARQLGVTPSAVIADLDSADAPTDLPLVRLPIRKDVTDTAAAVTYAREQGYTDFLILGGTGGRLDHQHANMLLLVTLARQGCRATLADAHNRITATVNSPVKLEHLSGWSLSLFAFDSVVRALSIHGASYPLERYDLSPTDPLCISNHTDGGECTVAFDSGTLLIFRSKD